MSGKVLPRLCVFFIGVPLILGLVMLPQYNHLAILLLITAISFIAATELFHIFSHNFVLKNKWLIVTLTTLIPLTFVFRAFFQFDFKYITYAYIFVILLFLIWEVFSNTTFENSNAQIVSSITIFTYAGLLFTFISRMAFLQNSTIVLILFLTMVFFCDSFAWFFGVLFGKNNKGFIKASPNKSIAGFFGGFLGSICSGSLAFLLKRELFEGSFFKMLLLAVITAFCAIIGDLVESILKRSSNCKDSGSVIPGRGGILDSIDSLIFAAPVFYFLITHLYQF